MRKAGWVKWVGFGFRWTRFLSWRICHCRTLEERFDRSVQIRDSQSARWPFFELSTARVTPLASSVSSESIRWISFRMRNLASERHVQRPLRVPLANSLNCRALEEWISLDSRHPAFVPGSALLRSWGSNARRWLYSEAYMPAAASVYAFWCGKQLVWFRTAFCLAL